ncbi:MAG TPA: pilus assembly protein TadG-related protein [Caulobacteraceae bacterium]|nr:pilus assembly protein TadG-related protein [Caulobacteraceae bacterium]
MAALVLPALIGMVGLVAEYGHGLLSKVENQRVADLAAYAGALAYNATSSTTAMTTAADNVAALNNIPASAVSVTLVSSPSGDGQSAVDVQVATQVPLLLSQMVGSGPQLPVSSTGYAELEAGVPACVIALKAGGTGVTLSGGTSVTAPACAVASNNTVTVPCGDTITTKSVAYNSAALPSEPCGGIVAPSGGTLSMVKTVTADPLATNSGVTTATAYLATVAGYSNPSLAAVPNGQDVAFGYNGNAATQVASVPGCSTTTTTGPGSGNTWTVNCSGQSSYNFGNITLSGGITVNFNTGGAANSVYNFSGSIDDGSATALTFGPGTYNIAKGLNAGGGVKTTFGAGTFNIGQMTSACSGGAKFSICNNSTTVFGGPSVFNLAGGVYNGGGASLTLGSGSTNSFVIGPSSAGDAVVAAGGSKTVFGDATGTGDLFQLIGNLNVISGGGSCMTISAAAQHDIKGNFASAGGTLLGSGVYTVTGYIGLGVNGGGDVTCNGVDIGINGTNVTLVDGGASTPTSGSCAGQSFCVAAGYSNITLTAPSAGTTAELVVIGPTSTSNTTGATFTEGASGTTLSGAFYYPNGTISLGGSASVGNGVGQCLELIGSQVTLTGGTTAASTCISSGATTSTVRLVQ